MLAMGSVLYLTWSLKKFLSPMMRIASTAAPNTGISTASMNFLTWFLTRIIAALVAPFVPSIILFSSVASPKLVFHLTSRILYHIDINDRTAGIQQAADMRVAMPKVSISGAGTT